MRLVLLGGAPGIGKNAVARAVLTHHHDTSDTSDPSGRDDAAQTSQKGPRTPLLQWVDVDTLWLHQPWRVDQVMRDLVAANLRAVLGNAAAAGVDVVVVTWTFHREQLRDVVTDAAPSGTHATSVQLVADHDTWRARFTADVTRPALDDLDGPGGLGGFFKQRYAQAQAMTADVVIDTSDLSIDQTAAQVAAVTLGHIPS